MDTCTYKICILLLFIIVFGYIHVLGKKKHKKIDERVTDILIRTWRGDGHWLIYLLRSIEKFVDKNSYRNVIITYDTSDSYFFDSYLQQFYNTLPIKTVVSNSNKGWVYGHNKGLYNAQIFAKMLAYTYSDADYFVHIDSDCVFNTYINSSHFFDSNGRVYLTPIPFNITEPNYKWKKICQDMLKIPVNYDIMNRMPLVFPRFIYRAVLNHISKVHNGRPISILQKMEEINEFTTFGAYLMTFQSELWTPPPIEKDNIVTISWSWGGFGPESAAFYECLLRAQKHTDCYFASLPPSASPTIGGGGQLKN